jgi:solute:Na+ symporter, SSS family
MGSVAGLPAAGPLISVNAVDYIIIALYFVFVLGIGFLARHEPAGAGTGRV